MYRRIACFTGIVKSTPALLAPVPLSLATRIAESFDRHNTLFYSPRGIVRSNCTRVFLRVTWEKLVGRIKSRTCCSNVSTQYFASRNKARNIFWHIIASTWLCLLCIRKQKLCNHNRINYLNKVPIKQLFSSIHLFLFFHYFYCCFLLLSLRFLFYFFLI